MHQPIRTAADLIRRLPTHELNARRARKQTLTRLPALAPTPTAPPPAPPAGRRTIPGHLLPQNQLHPALLPET
jgi:hypothetical protein